MSQRPTRPMRPAAGRPVRSEAQTESAVEGASAPARRTRAAGRSPSGHAAAATSAPAPTFAKISGSVSNRAARRAAAEAEAAAQDGQIPTPVQRAPHQVRLATAAGDVAGLNRPSARAVARSAVAAATPESAVDSDESAADKPRDMVAAVEQLANLLTIENDSLRRHEMDVVRDNVPTKQALTRAYMEQMIAFRKNPTLIENLTDERRKILKDAVIRLEPLIAENGRMLKAKIDTINRFMGAVVDAVRDQKSKGSVVYGGKGSMRESNAEHNNLAVAINKEF